MCVEARRFLRACSGGLAEKTALVDIAVQGVLVRDADADRRIRSGATALRPGEPFYGIGDHDWPTAFLVPDDVRSTIDDDLACWLGDWVVALTVAILRWGRDPVLRGRVLDATPGRLRLAIPWYRVVDYDTASPVIDRWRFRQS